MSVLTAPSAPLPELDLDSFRSDPAATLDALRPNRIVRSLRGYEVIAYDLAGELLADQRLRPMSAADFSAHGATPYIADFVDKGIFLFMAPERHREIRKIFVRGFGGQQMKNHQDVMHDIANRLINELLERGQADLVESFTQQFAAESLSRLLGFPAEDIPQFVHAALDLRHLVFVPMEPHIAKIEGALDTLREYATNLLAERRRNPQDDFLSSLIEAEQIHGRLTTDEVVWGTVNLLLGGIDTTNFQLASTLMHLINHDAWERAAADPDVRLAAIEEATRLTPVSTMLGRKVHETIEIDGISLPVGADVRINMVAAGRDPAHFDDPHTFRLDRTTPFRIIFGAGVHQCVGRPLATPELRIGCELLTTRLTNIRLTDAPVMHSWTEAFYGPHTLPASFERR
jgi:cytochrome P450